MPDMLPLPAGPETIPIECFGASKVASSARGVCGFGGWPVGSLEVAWAEKVGKSLKMTGKLEISKLSNLFPATAPVNGLGGAEALDWKRFRTRREREVVRHR